MKNLVEYIQESASPQTILNKVISYMENMNDWNTKWRRFDSQDEANDLNDELTDLFSYSLKSFNDNLEDNNINDALNDPKMQKAIKDIQSKYTEFCSVDFIAPEGTKDSKLGRMCDSLYRGIIKETQPNNIYFNYEYDLQGDKLHFDCIKYNDYVIIAFIFDRKPRYVEQATCYMAIIR